MRFVLDVLDRENFYLERLQEISGHSTFWLRYDELDELGLDFLKILPPCISKLELNSKLGFRGSDFSYLNKSLWLIPKTITSLKVGGGISDVLIGYSFHAFYSFFSNIPPHIHSLELRYINFGKSGGFGDDEIPAGDLAKILSVLPPSLTTLKLIQVNLGQLSADELTQILTTLPPGLTKLDLSHNGVFEKNSRAELSKIFSAIPANVHTFSFKGNYFNDHHSGMVSEKLKAFSSLPPTLRHLDLSACKYVSDYIDSLFKELPKQISSVALRHNMIGLETNKSLVKAFKAIPQNITTLDLGYNDFDTKNTAELAKLFAALPSHLLSLCLGGNYLCSLPSEGWLEICRALPPYLTFLDLSWDNLQILSTENLANYFRAIPQTVTTLILKDNNLGAFSEEQLESALIAIPSTIKTINLSDNKLHLLSSDTLEKLKETLPQIERLYLSAAEMEAMSIEQRQALRKIFPNLSKVFFVDAEGEVIGETPIAQTNLAKKYDFQTNFPSLLELLLADLPKKTRVFNASTAPIPNELKKQLEDSQLVKIKKSMLSGIQFDNHLKIIKDKIREMKKKKKKDNRYQEAFLVARSLYDQLEGAKRDFLASQSLSVGTFKKTCQDCIDGAEGELEKHRGWKETLANFASALASISTFGIWNYVTGKGFLGLFKVKTDSQKKIENFKNDIDRLYCGGSEKESYLDYMEAECSSSDENDEKIRESYRY